MTVVLTKDKFIIDLYFTLFAGIEERTTEGSRFRFLLSG